jgi:class 3 adenylate cyclase/tetratricopeptide (TPR) repeat protein
VKKLEATRAQGGMVGERRIVTMLFCDVKGSTAAAERLDPEDWTEIINGAFEHMIKPVYKYEGTVARLMGDGILAFFGAPIAHEDDSQRAVLAGLDIVEGIRGYREDVKHAWEIDLNVRVGINTGMVVVGTVGSDLRMEYTAMGDAINLAARMEQTAQPGTVQIAEDTYKLVAPLFEFEELDGVDVKGKEEPVRAYRVLHRKRHPGRVRGIEGLDAPLVGRGKEMEQLKQACANLEQGIGALVCLVGEAGVGKSRLVRELKTTAFSQESPPRWYQVACPSYETAQPYGLFQHLIRRVSEISQNEPPEKMREKLLPIVKQFPDERQERVWQVLAALFSLGSSLDHPPISGEAFKHELFDVMLTYFQGWIAGSPTVLFFDDVQWVDSASVELLLHMHQLVDSVPILMIYALRPDRQVPGWELTTRADADYPHRYTEIELGQLSEAESHALVDHLLLNEDLPAKLRTHILEKAAGNPLFVEEVVRAMIDSGVLRRDETGTRWQAVESLDDIDIPDNLQSLLVSSIDRLEEQTRRTLQLAAVIGRSFYYRVLVALSEFVGDSTGELDRELNKLQRINMIQEAARLPEPEYMFRNPLTKEVAYETILLKQRRLFHQRVGEAIENLYPDRLEEFAPILGYHFAEAQQYDRAMEYYIQAADQAYRLYANSEAATYYTRALETARQQDVSDEKFKYLYTRRGRALELNSQFTEALKNYEQMEAQAHEREAASLELESLVLQGTIRSTANELADPDIGKSLSLKALELSRKLGDEAAEAKIQWNLANIYRFTEGAEKALVAGERSLLLARKHDLREQIAYTLNDLPYIYWSVGEHEKARQAVSEASELWRQMDNKPMLTDSLATATTSHVFTGEFDKAIALSDEAFEISKSIGNLWGQSYSRFVVGNAYWELGNPARAIEMMRQAITFGEKAQFLVVQVWTRGHLALVYANLGLTKKAREIAERAQSLAQGRLLMYYPFTQAVMAQIELLEGDISKASDELDHIKLADSALDFIFIPFLKGAQIQLALAQNDQDCALDIIEEHFQTIRFHNQRISLPSVFYLQAKAQIDMGQVDAARESLIKAQTEAQAMGSRWWLWQILARLGELEVKADEFDAAKELREQAYQIALDIADRTGSEQLRESFLAKPDVRRLLEVD